MNLLFGRKKSPQDVVRSTLNNISTLNESKDEKSQQKAREKVSANLSSMKFLLYGDPESDPKPDTVQKLVQLLFSSQILLILLENIRQFEFEAKKDIAQVFMFLLRRGQHNRAIEYVVEHHEMMQILVEGYCDPEVALNCGSILRECIRHEELCNLLLESPLFYNFFEYVQKNNFDVASDAFATFKTLLTKHKQLAARFLLENYDKVFAQYNTLIQSDNYVTKRQSLKLLGEVILDRSNFQVMMKYINDPENLKIMMNLLRGPSKTIQFEAFHVFKVFVANPKKTRPVVEILLRNQQRLIEFLKKFCTDKDNEQFTEEKTILLNTLQKLTHDDVIRAQPFQRPSSADTVSSSRPVSDSKSSVSRSQPPTSSPPSQSETPEHIAEAQALQQNRARQARHFHAHHRE